MAEASGCIYDPERGYAIHLWSGKTFFPQDVRDDDVKIDDIAHGLAMTCRYGGQADEYYSVAQHSVYCWEQARERGLSIELCREALLHDAVEAYMGVDFPRPYKMMIPALAEFEKMLEKQINPILDIPVEKSPEIKEIDELMLATEMPILFQTHGTYSFEGEEVRYHGNNPVMEGLPERLPWTSLHCELPNDAERNFMGAYRLQIRSEIQAAIAA